MSKKGLLQGAELVPIIRDKEATSGKALSLSKSIEYGVHFLNFHELW